MAVALEREPVVAADEEASAIRELEKLLAELPSAYLVGSHGERSDLPQSVRTLLSRIVHELARGNAVTIVPVQAELTTQQAADLLNVSRPFLVKLLESNEIPYHFVGSHRRIPFNDLMDYRRKRSEARRVSLKEMAREAQEMGTYE